MGSNNSMANKQLFFKLWGLRFTRISHDWKKGGLREVHNFFLNRLKRKNKFLIFEIDLADNPLKVNRDQRVTIRMLENAEHDINRLSSFWFENNVQFYPLYINEGQVKRLISVRLEAGEICVIAESKNDIVHFNWISILNRCPLNSNEPIKYLDFQPGRHAYSYNTFTHPDYRGHGIVFAVKNFMIDFLIKSGCEKIFTCIGEANIASIKVHEKIARHIQNIQVTRYIVFDRLKIEKVGRE